MGRKSYQQEGDRLTVELIVSLGHCAQPSTRVHVHFALLQSQPRSSRSNDSRVVDEIETSRDWDPITSSHDDEVFSCFLQTT